MNPYIFVSKIKWHILIDTTGHQGTLLTFCFFTVTSILGSLKRYGIIISQISVDNVTAMRSNTITLKCAFKSSVLHPPFKTSRQLMDVT